MIAPDDATYEYIAGKRFAPKGEEFDAAVETLEATSLLTKAQPTTER